MSIALVEKHMCVRKDSSFATFSNRLILWQLFEDKYLKQINYG